MTKYGIFRGEEMVGRVIFKDIKDAINEKDKMNKQFDEFRKATGKSIKDVEVREFAVKRQTAQQKLREMLG